MKLEYMPSNMKDRFRDICLRSSNVMYQFTDITKSQNRKEIKMSLECMPIEQTKNRTTIA